MEPLLELSIELPKRGSRQRQRALHQALRQAILDGRLHPGLRLPSTRALASAYGMARKTVVSAYDLLLSEGYVVARAGSGTFVTTAPRQLPRKRASLRIAERLNGYWRQAATTVIRPPTHPPRFDFRVGAPDSH